MSERTEYEILYDLYCKGLAALLPAWQAKVDEIARLTTELAMTRSEGMKAAERRVAEIATLKHIVELYLKEIEQLRASLELVQQNRDAFAEESARFQVENERLTTENTKFRGAVNKAFETLTTMKKENVELRAKLAGIEHLVYSYNPRRSPVTIRNDIKDLLTKKHPAAPSFVADPMVCVDCIHEDCDKCFTATGYYNKYRKNQSGSIPWTPLPENENEWTGEGEQTGEFTGGINDVIDAEIPPRDFPEPENVYCNKNHLNFDHGCFDCPEKLTCVFSESKDTRPAGINDLVETYYCAGCPSLLHGECHGPDDNLCEIYSPFFITPKKVNVDGIANNAAPDLDEQNATGDDEQRGEK
jgi:hypothetical protein